MSVPMFVLSWAEEPGPARVLTAARARAEAGRLGPRATLDVELTGDERRQVARLLGPVWAASGEAVKVARVREALATHDTTLEALLVEVGGPLHDLRAIRRVAAEAKRGDREAGVAVLVGLGGDVERAVLERCLVGAQSWEARATQIALVVSLLDGRVESGEAPIRLAVLAAQLFRNAHALDRAEALGRAVARFLAGRGAAAGSWVDPVGDAAAWHRAWEAGGVVCDGVSAQVLVLNLPLTGDGAATALTEVAGEPVWLTLRSLLRPFALTDGVPEVFVCENPAIVEAAADRHGASSRPLVCTYGLPNLATMTLLEALAPRTTLWIRADGDAVGWRIVERLLRLPGARPWRMPGGFDRYEEEILDDLLADLSPGRSSA